MAQAVDAEGRRGYLGRARSVHGNAPRASNLLYFKEIPEFPWPRDLAPALVPHPPHGGRFAMQGFTNILVGVDLPRCRPLDASALTADAREVIDHAVWLARVNGAKVRFISALNISQDALHQLREEEHSHARRTV